MTRVPSSRTLNLPGNTENPEEFATTTFHRSLILFLQMEPKRMAAISIEHASQGLAKSLRK
jgi:hypothetical protein